jgi:HEAT repeat protein
MTPNLARLRHWAKIVKRVLARWQLLLRRPRSSRLARAAQPLETASSPHNDNAFPAASLPDRGPPERLLHELSLASDWQSRARAAEGLTAAKADGVVAGLVRALSDPSVEVAVAAIQALSGRQEARVDSALREVVASTDGYFSPVTRARAIDVLAKRLARSDLGPIFDAVRDVDADVSIAAIIAIGEHAPQAASGILFPLLVDRSGYFLPPVRLAATQALENAGVLTQEGAVQLLEDEEDQEVRQVLEDALARMPSSRLEVGQSG